MWLKTFKYTYDDKSFYFVWNFAQMWKINMKIEYLIFFWRKKSLDLQKIKKNCCDIFLLVLVNNFLNV